MNKFKKIDNSLDELKMTSFDNPKSTQISSLVIENGKAFNILVKSGDNVQVNQPILENCDGQKVLSSISGKVKDISLKQNYKSELTYCIDIENDFLNKLMPIKKILVNNKNDFINLIKNYGVINKDFLIYNYFENLDKTLYICAFDEKFIFNNFVVLSNFFDEIKSVIKRIKTLFNIEKVVFYTCKNNFKSIKKLAEKKGKIYKKAPKINALNLEDLLNIYNALKGIPQLNSLISITGKALKKNVVLNVKNGTKFDEIIEYLGGFKQNIEEIENYKYTAMLAYNDEIILKNKIKKCKNQEDKKKLIKMLNNKQNEANENIYSRREDYYQKLLDCLSISLVSEKTRKIEIKNYNTSISNNVYGFHLLNYRQFKN